MDLTKIYQDPNLYGHRLISLHQKICNFSTGEFSIHPSPDPGTLVIEKDYFIAKRISYQKGNTYTYELDFLFQKPLCDAIEFLARRIFGTCAVGISGLTLLPIAFVAKMIHSGMRYMHMTFDTNPHLQKVKHLWNRSDLFGHAFTSAPSKCYQFATRPLHWHLRPNGTDRRSLVTTINYESYGQIIHHKREYPLFPFELFEFTYRRLVGGALTLATALISPLGIAAKAVHLSSKRSFKAYST